MRQALVYRGDGDYWVAEVPSLPGCVSQGTSVEDELTNVKGAIELYIERLVAENRTVPEDHFDALVIAV